MQLKKFLPLVLLLVLVLVSGCGEENKPAAPAAIKIGMLKNLNASEIEFDGFLSKIADTFALKTSPHEVVYFDNLNSMLMALDSGQIDEVSTYLCVADYLIARNPKIEILEGHTLEFIDAFCLALRANEPDLKKSLDDAILEMSDDGTFASLTKTYINDVRGKDEPPAVAFENFDGAETIKVAVTGDLPVLDLIRADGTPAGFSTAVLAELGKRLQKNIEVVQIESGARAAALTSGQVDVIFWAIVPVSEIIPANVDKPDGVELTSPYYRDKIVHIGLKKN